MKALILIADGFEDVELLAPYYRLLEEGMEVDIAAPAQGEVKGKHGYSVVAGFPISKAKPEDYGLLLLPGGRGPEAVRLEEGALYAARSFMKAGKPVAAICHGPQVLASAGVLEGRTVTGWEGIRDDLRSAGAEVTDREVVVDGNLVTSRRPSDIPAFNREMMRLVRGG